MILTMFDVKSSVEPLIGKDYMAHEVKIIRLASSAVRLRRDGVTLTFDLSNQKRNQVICVPRCTSDKSLAKIYQ